MQEVKHIFMREKESNIFTSREKSSTVKIPLNEPSLLSNVILAY